MKRSFTKNYVLASLSAFSLIELLIAISIISLLLAIIVPVLGRAKATACQVVCQLRLRQWGVVFEEYAAEHNGLYPHIDGHDREADIADDFGWVDMLPPLMWEEPWREYEQWHKPGRDTIFQCPMAKPTGDNYNYNPAKIGFFSYAMNSCLELDRNCWPPYGQSTGNDMPSFLNVASIKKPSQVILLFEQLLDPERGFNNTGLDRSVGRYCGSYPKAFSARHPKQRDKLGGDILYCDYHVEWQETVWKPEWPVDDPDFQAPPRSDKNWFPY